MSHASLLVALDTALPDLQTALQYQMAPFSENDAWFEDGSRWDWWQIGGRYPGLLTGYDPETDPRNPETDPRNVAICEMCGGTGIRPGGLAQFGQAWFDGNHGCNGCQGKGTHLRWPTQWEDVGNVVFIAELTTEKRNGGFPAHYAFLRNRVWHEHERMGWFGGAAATECEQQGKDVHICTHEKDGARIISWGGSDSWDKMFYPRFVEPLSPDTFLVTVDYHV